VTRLAVHRRATFVLVRPHYAENVGAAARAMKTMGFSRLVLVEPSRAALPHQSGAVKMAAKSWDVLEGAEMVSSVAEAIAGYDHVYVTSSHASPRALSARAAAARIVRTSAHDQRSCILFGNEKTGLSEADRRDADLLVRIPMIAPQPSVNLAQAVQIIAYELFTAALLAERRKATRSA
jgi:tRNA/rRNA methyltransferase